MQMRLKNAFLNIRWLITLLSLLNFLSVTVFEISCEADESEVLSKKKIILKWKVQGTLVKTINLSQWEI